MGADCPDQVSPDITWSEAGWSDSLCLRARRSTPPSSNPHPPCTQWEEPSNARHNNTRWLGSNTVKLTHEKPSQHILQGIPYSSTCLENHYQGIPLHPSLFTCVPLTNNMLLQLFYVIDTCTTKSYVTMPETCVCMWPDLWQPFHHLTSQAQKAYDHTHVWITTRPCEKLWVITSSFQ